MYWLKICKHLNNQTEPTVIGEDVATLSLIDDMTLGQLLSPGLVWVAQLLCGQLGDCALEEVSSNAGLRQGWRALLQQEQEL